MTARHIRIFNPQLTTIDGKILKVNANRTRVQVLLTTMNTPVVI